MPETKTGLPTDEELRSMAIVARGDTIEAFRLLREVRSRCLRWAADQGDSHVNIREILREAAREEERG